MKKNKRHLYKRLPKYALGTMKPIDLGYQAGRGIGSAHVETQPEVSLSGEIQATRAGALPRAINSFMGYTPYIINNLDLSNRTRRASTNITSKELTSNTPLYNTPLQPTTQTLSLPTPNWESQLFVPKNITAGYDLPGMTANIAKDGTSVFGTVGADMTKSVSEIAAERGGNILTGKAAEALADQTQKELSKQAAKQVGKNIAGKVLGVVGSVKGLVDLGMQAADFGSHRSSGDMLANLGRQHYTTDKGNTYDTYLGPNVNNEVALEKANARAKQLNWLTSSVGTGATIGGTVGSFVPGLGNLLGTGIGALGGLLVGGLGSLFGWGDNTEDVEREARILADNTAMYNRQQRAVAGSKDTAAEFNDRIGTAAEGKNAYGPMGAKKGDNINTPKLLFDVNAENNMSIGIPTSKLMPGETVFNKQNIQNWGRVPGKGNKDNIYSSVRPGDSNVVLTNKGGISKIGAAVLKSNVPEDIKRWQLNELEKKQAALQEFENNQSNMKKYKNGKLPGFWRGTDYLMSAIPHIAALGLSRNQYNRAKYADTHAPSTYVNNAAGAQALNELAHLRFDPTQYLTDARRAYNQANFQANRMAGLGAGGQAILRNTNYQNYLDSLGKIRIAQQDADNKYRAAHANALAEYGAREQEALINDNIRRFQWQQQQNATKEGWMAQYEKNGLTALADLASDVMGVRQFNRSEDYQNRMLTLYNQQVENDSANAKAALAQAEQARLDREAAYRNVVKNASKTAYPAFASQGLLRTDGLWNLFGQLNAPQLSAPTVNPKYMKYFKPQPLNGYEDGKDGVILRDNTYVYKDSPFRIRRMSNFSPSDYFWNSGLGYPGGLWEREDGTFYTARAEDGEPVIFTREQADSIVRKNKDVDRKNKLLRFLRDFNKRH